MRGYLEAGLNHFYRAAVNFFKDRTAYRRCLPFVPVVISLAIAGAIYGAHLFDFSVPVDGDVRAHIFKIELVYDALSHFSWPGWVSSWYQGYPFDLYYPPGFYILGAALTFVLRDAVIAYKVILFFALAGNGLVTYYFARRFLRLDSLIATLCLIAYESSTPLLVNYLYGEGPNLVGWSVSLLFLTIYLSNVAASRIKGLWNSLLPGTLLGVAILIHPFPVIFVTLTIVIYHLIWLAHRHGVGTLLKSQLPYAAAVFVVGGLIGTFYWLPAMLNLKYASSIFTLTEYMWPGGMTYVLLLCAVSFLTGLIMRLKVRDDITLDFLLACLFLAMALGMGATHYFPLGLGVLLHEFRFATIMAPFFAILVMFYRLDRIPVSFVRRNLMPGIFLGVFTVIAAFLIEKPYVRDFFSRPPSEMSAAAFFALAAKFWQAEALAMLVPAILTVTVFVAVFMPRPQPTPVMPKTPYLLAVAASALVLMTSVVPMAYTYDGAVLSRLFSYVGNYRSPQYADLLQKAKDGRLIISMSKGSLCEGDSFVTFGQRWGVETVNGPYSQGDTKFFRYTVHLEWEDRWLDNRATRENLMQEGGTRYVFVRNTRPLPADMEGLTVAAQNEYGKLLEIKQEVARAVAVTPVLLDVKNPEEVADFFNIMVPGGYKLVFVDARTVEENLREKFAAIMTDDIAKAVGYRGKRVIVLSDFNAGAETGLTEVPGVTFLRFAYAEFINNYFYHGVQGNGVSWLSFDNSKDAKMSGAEVQRLGYLGDQLDDFLSGLTYRPAGYVSDGREIQLTAPAGFTLVKDSYFYYWNSDKGDILPTSQGFVLVYSDDVDPVLKYKVPPVNAVAAVVTLAALGAALSMLVFLRYRRRA